MATIKDIAHLAGVSPMTVSRYFNKPDMLKDETRMQVEEIVRKNNFSLNSVAQSLVYNCTNVIYVYIAGDIGSLHPFLLMAIAGIGEALGERGYSMLLSRKSYSNETCDGIIAMGATIEEETELAKLAETKRVLLFGNNEQFGNWIDIDNKYGSYLITEYVLSKGYKNIAYVGIDSKKRVGLDRISGFLKAMEDYGIKTNPEWMREENNHEIDGHRAAEHLLTDKRIDAVICASDILAIGVMRYCSEHGIKVPHDLAVTGFDGLGFEVMTYPHLTTVEQPVYEAGRQLARRMLNMIEGSEPEDVSCYIAPVLKKNNTV